jgi:hypothetical protein
VTAIPSANDHEGPRWRRRLLLVVLALLLLTLTWRFGALITGPAAAETSAAVTPAPSAVGSGHGGAQTGGADFTITGAGVRDLLLGVSRAIPLTLTNPNDTPIFVTALTVTVSADSTPTGCSSADNVQLVQSNASSADPVLVPANGSVTLTGPPRAPRITLVNLPDVNQDACKKVVFGLTYTGSAHS